MNENEILNNSDLSEILLQLSKRSEEVLQPFPRLELKKKIDFRNMVLWT